MIGSNRAAVTLLGTAAAAVLLWVAALFNPHHTGGYWAALGVLAGAGLLLGVLQMRGRTGHPPAMFLLGFLPVFIAGSWVLLGMQPHDVWGRHQILSWSHDIHVKGLVRDVGMWTGLIAFAIGYTFGLTFEPAPVRREEAVVTRRRRFRRTSATSAATAAPAAATHDRRAADEPLAAERTEVAAERGTTSSTRAAERTPVR
jgi:hypothetical protein